MPEKPINYVLCSNPRSGTTLLCSMLEQTKLAGKPNSFFRQQSLSDWAEAWRFDGPVDVSDPIFSAAYFNAMRSEGCGDTDVFGMRLMGSDLRFAGAWLSRLYPNGSNDVARLEAAFGPLRFIHLSRRDKLAEAVSYVRAEQTGLWHQNADGSDLERMSPTGTNGFDAAVIGAHMAELRQLDQNWESWFAREGIRPLRMTYEALGDDPQGALAMVLTHIGCDPQISRTISPSLRKLADQTNANWIAQYRALYPNS